MKERIGRVGARGTGNKLPKFAVRARFALAMIALVALCSHVVAQENTANYWIAKGDDLLFNKCNPLEALESYEKAIQIDPENMTAWNGKSMVLDTLSVQTYSKILNLSETKLAKNPQDIEALQTSAMALASLGNQEESNQFLKKAIDVYDQEIKDNPKNATAWFLKAGLISILNGSEEAAISAYDKVIELNGSKMIDALITKGNILLNLGRYNESLDTIDKAIQLDPENPSVWYEKATYYNVLGKYNESLDAYEMITKLEPEKASAWLFKGNVLKALGRQTDADAAYAKAKELGHQE